MKKNKISKNWIIQQHRDVYFKQSRIEGYRSRSAFKLIELNKKFRFIKKNSNLIDIGSCPGGWSQVSRNIIKSGKIVSLDLKLMQNIEGVKFIHDDFLNTSAKDKILIFLNNKVDIVISDMAADTTGNKNLDCIRTNQLSAEVINFSSKILMSTGTVVAKLFMGEDFLYVKDLAKKKFKKVEFFKPESSRNESKETYIHCSSLKAL